LEYKYLHCCDCAIIYNFHDCHCIVHGKHILTKNSDKCSKCSELPSLANKVTDDVYDGVVVFPNKF